MEQNPKKLDRAHKIALGIISAVCCCVIGISVFALAAPNAVSDLTDQHSEIAKSQESENETAENEPIEPDEQANSEENDSQDESNSSADSTTTSNEAKTDTGNANANSGNSAKKSTSRSNEHPTLSNNSKSTSPSSDNASDTITVSVKVYGSAKGITVSKNTSATFRKGANAYDALCATGLDVKSHQEPGGTWVDSIGGLAHTDKTNDGWMYHVNGSTPMVLCSAYKLKDGDSIYWEFVE